MLAERPQSLCSRQGALVPPRLTTVQITPSNSEIYSQQYSHSFYGCRWLYPPLRKEASLCNLASSHGTDKTRTRAFPRAPQSWTSTRHLVLVQTHIRQLQATTLVHSPNQAYRRTMAFLAPSYTWRHKLVSTTLKRSVFTSTAMFALQWNTQVWTRRSM